MKYIKMLGLLAVAAAALMAFAGTASATTLTSPTGTTYTSTISAASEGSTTLTSSFFVTIHCNKSAVSGKVETHGAGKNAGGKISSLSFSECTDDVTVKNGGSLAINSSSQVFSTGAEVIVHSSVGECIFGTNNTDIGDLTDSHDTGNKTATLDIASKSIPVIGGSFFCPSSAVWEGSYIVNTPDKLYVD